MFLGLGLGLVHVHGKEPQNLSHVHGVKGGGGGGGYLQGGGGGYLHAKLSGGPSK